MGVELKTELLSPSVMRELDCGVVTTKDLSRTIVERTGFAFEQVYSAVIYTLTKGYKVCSEERYSAMAEVLDNELAKLKVA